MDGNAMCSQSCNVKRDLYYQCLHEVKKLKSDHKCFHTWLENTLDYLKSAFNFSERE